MAITVAAVIARYMDRFGEWLMGVLVLGA